MPTFKPVGRFWADYHRLSREQKAAFRRAVPLFVAGLAAGHFHRSSSVKGYKSEPGVFEMTWAPDGWALWQYGEPVPGRPGPHIEWLRIGDHRIFDDL